MTAAAPRWPAVEEMLDGILQRRYYTNHGPLAQALERELERRFEARHAVVVTNPAIATVMMLEGLALSGSVILSAAAASRWAHAVEWAGLVPVVRDLGRDLSQLPAHCSALFLSEAADDDLLRFAAAHRLVLCGDAPWTAGCAHPVVLTLPAVANWPPAAAILTDDDGYAAKLRNIRSSYGAGPPVTVARTANGRLSEAQAGLALLLLDGAAPPPVQHAVGAP